MRSRFSTGSLDVPYAKVDDDIDDVIPLIELHKRIHSENVDNETESYDVDWEKTWLTVVW